MILRYRARTARALDAGEIRFQEQLYREVAEARVSAGLPDPYAPVDPYAPEACKSCTCPIGCLA